MNPNLLPQYFCFLATSPQFPGERRICFKISHPRKIRARKQWHEGPGKGNVMINIDEKVYDSTAEKKEQDVPGSSTMIDSVIVILKKLIFLV
jgi:hypothetical protein